jgi:TonB family protein
VSLEHSGILLAVLVVAITGGTVGLRAQDDHGEIVRRVRSRVEPIYPDLARKMNLTGTVKIEVVVAPNGTVKEAKVVGGHPVLAGAAVEAARKWRFEPASVETSGVVEFKFDAHH